MLEFLLARAMVRTNGWWRSLVAHLTGGQGVAGSNPVHPTSKSQVRWYVFRLTCFVIYGLNRNRPQSSVTRLHVKPARACLTVANATPVVRRPGSGSLRMGVSSDHKFHPDSCRRRRHRKRAGSRLGARWHELTVGLRVFGGTPSTKRLKV